MNKERMKLQVFLTLISQSIQNEENKDKAEKKNNKPKVWQQHQFLQDRPSFLQLLHELIFLLYSKVPIN